MKSIKTGRAISFAAASTRAALFASAALICAGLPVAAQAQDAAADEGDEIVVTATKREQTLQDVPVAVTVTSGETIERAQIRDIRDLTSVVPSLRVNQLQSSANTNFYIRGFGNGANNAGIEPSVGLFIDGVYRSRSAAMIGDLPDVTRVEVLRGPQSTLFGKNASAGVISFVTAEPKFEFGGSTEATYGNRQAATVKASITGPITDQFAVSLAAGANVRDGYVRDLGSHTRTNERNRWFVRSQALFEPSADLKFRMIFDYSKIDENCCAVVNLRRSAASSIIQLIGGRLNDPAHPFADVIYSNIPSTNKVKSFGFSNQIDYDMGNVKLTSITAVRENQALTNQDSDFTSSELLGRNWQDVKINTFTQELRLASDFDGPLNFLLGAFYFGEKVKQRNEIFWGNNARVYADQLVRGATGGALNIGSRTPTQDLELIFGGLEAQAALNPALAGKYVGKFFGANTGLRERYNLRDDAISMFGQTDFEITDRLTLTAGLSWNHDKKSYETNTTSDDVFSSVNLDDPRYGAFREQLILGGLLQRAGVNTSNPANIFAFATNPATAATYASFVSTAATLKNVPAANPLAGLKALQFLPPFLNVPNVVEPGKLKDDDLSYTLRLAYDVNDNVNVYLNWATGYKAASINLSRDSRPFASDRAAITAAGIAPVNLSYSTRYAGPEDSTVYEAGAKGKWGSTMVNLAVFKQIIKGFQSNIFTGTGFVLTNAGKQSTWGVEFEASTRPMDPLTLSLSATYLKPKYDSFQASAFGDLSGTRPGGVPPWSVTAGFAWNQPMGDDNLILSANYHYESTFQQVEGLPGFLSTSAAGVVDPASIPVAIAAARISRHDVNQLDASLTYAMANGLEIGVWGRNLTDDRYLLQVFDSPAQKGSISGYPSEPRTYGAMLRYKW